MMVVDPLDQNTCHSSTKMGDNQDLSLDHNKDFVRVGYRLRTINMIHTIIQSLSNLAIHLYQLVEHPVMLTKRKRNGRTNRLQLNAERVENLVLQRNGQKVVHRVILTKRTMITSHNLSTLLL